MTEHPRSLPVADTRSYEQLLDDVEQAAYLRGWNDAQARCQFCAAVRRPLYLCAGVLAVLVWVVVA